MAELTISIPNEKVADFKAGFLRMNPVPVENTNPDPEGEPVWEPTMAENVWIRRCIRTYLIEQYKSGKHWLVKDAEVIVVDEDIIDVV